MTDVEPVFSDDSAGRGCKIGQCRVQAYKDKEPEEPAASSSNLSADWDWVMWTVSYKLSSAVLAEYSRHACKQDLECV